MAQFPAWVIKNIQKWFERIRNRNIRRRKFWNGKSHKGITPIKKKKRIFAS